MDEDQSPTPDSSNRLERVHAYHFIEHRGTGERPFDWYADWETLWVVMFDISITDSICASEYQWFPIGAAHDDDLSRSPRPVDQKNVTDEERERFVDFVDDQPIKFFGDPTDEDFDEAKRRANVFNGRFQTPTTERRRFINGSVALEGDRTISWMRDGGPPIKSFFGQGCAFGLAQIGEREAQTKGIVSLIDEKKATPVGDLQFALSLPTNQFNVLVERLGEIGPDAKIELGLKVLAFRSEVDRFLSEYFHPQTYCLEQTKFGASGSVVLESVVISTVRSGEPKVPQRYHQPSELGVDEAETASEAKTRQTQAPDPERQMESTRGNPAMIQRPSERQVVFALWTIALLLAINLLI